MTVTGARPAPAAEGAHPGGIGERVRRRETQRFVRGEGTYVDDRSWPNMYHLAVVRSTFAHARVVSVDAKAALEIDGVELVMSGSELVEVLEPIRGRYPIASDTVRFVGDPVAVVVARDRYLAEDGAQLVQVEYDPLPAYNSPFTALEPDATQIFRSTPGNCSADKRFGTANVDAAFAAADVIVEVSTHSSRAAACPMEPRSYAAKWDDGAGTLNLWTSTAATFAVRKDVAISLGLPEARVRVQVADVGGSFGAKNPVYPEEIITSWLARHLGRPVKYTETREEHLHATHQGRDQYHHLRGAFTSDGRLIALDDDIVADMGSSETVDNSLDSGAHFVPGPYRVQEYRYRARGVVTNKTPHGSLRGIGKADASFAIERLMDRAAGQLSIDRAEIRLRNFIPPEEFPYRTATGALLDSARYAHTMTKALDMAGYPDLVREAAGLRERGIHRGIGVALVLEPTSATRDRVGLGFASCRVTLTPTGDVLVYSGTSQQGQGHETTLSQVVSSRLGIPQERISVYLSDTHSSPFGFTAGSSRSTTVLMSAAYRAGDKAADKAKQIAGHRLGVDPELLDMAGGTVVAPDGRSMTLAEIAHIAYVRIDHLPPGVDPGFELLATFSNPHVDFEPGADGKYNTFAIYPYDATVAVVDVDVETGTIALRKYVTVHDCGNPINPTVVATQHMGATVQGIGLALLEELPYDDQGQPMVSSFLEYLLPSVHNLPEVLIMDHTITPSPFTPHGGKGAGETGTLSPPSVFASAIEDALGSAARMEELPFTPERVRNAYLATTRKDA